MKKVIRVPVPLTEDQHERLAAAAEVLGLSLSGYLRLAALERAERCGGGGER